MILSEMERLRREIRLKLSEASLHQGDAEGFLLLNEIKILLARLQALKEGG